MERELLRILSLFSFLTFSVGMSLAVSAQEVISCTEGVETGSYSYKVTHIFLFDKPGVLSGARLRFEDRKRDMTVTTATKATIEAVANDVDYMPDPIKIDNCLANETKIGKPGRENIFAIMDCQRKVGHAKHPVPVTVRIKINRVNGNFEIDRSQDQDAAHSTTSFGSCIIRVPKL